MRQGELMALTWDSINWITKKITVDKNYTHGRLGTPKTGKIRVIDMSDELAKSDATAESLKAKTEALTEKSMKLGEAVYKAAQEAANTSSENGENKSGEDGTRDADFSEKK